MRYRPREEAKKTKKIVVNITPSDHQFLKVIAADQGVPMGEFVLRALRHYLGDIMKEDKKLES